jgi:hypothetical protein
MPVVAMRFATDWLCRRRRERLGCTGRVGVVLVVMVMVVVVFVIISSLGHRTSLGSLAVPVVTMRFATSRLGGRRSQRLCSSGIVVVVVVMVIIMLSVSGSLGLGSKSRPGTVAVPVVTVRLTSDRLGRRGSKSLLGKDGGEEAEKGNSESGGLHFGRWYLQETSVYKGLGVEEDEDEGKETAREWNLKTIAAARAWTD